MICYFSMRHTRVCLYLIVYMVGICVLYNIYLSFNAVITMSCVILLHLCYSCISTIMYKHIIPEMPEPEM